MIVPIYDNYSISIKAYWNLEIASRKCFQCFDDNMGSRVGDIRRKFEGLSDVSKEATNAGRPLRYNQTGNQLKQETEIQLKNPSFNTKGFIKRSHAFRSDKINPNVGNNDSLQCSSKKANPANNNPAPDSRLFLDSMLSNHSSAKTSESTNGRNTIRASLSVKTNSNSNHLVSRNIMTKEHSTTIIKCLAIQKADDTLKIDQLPFHGKPSTVNYLPNANTHIKINEDKDLSSTMNDIRKVDKRSNIRGTSLDRYIESQIDSTFISDKNPRSADANFSNSLKKVLSSPLPSGPPPKKPPRTFAHSADDSLLQCSKGISEEDLLNTNLCSNFNKIKNNTKPIFSPIRSKTESEIKLKKLEIALLNHRQQGKMLQPKTENGAIRALEKDNKCVNQSYLKPGGENSELNNYTIAIHNRSLPDTPKEKNTNSYGCFNAGMLSCSNTIDLVRSSHIYDVPFQPKSQFYVKDLSPDETKQVIGTLDNKFDKESTLFNSTNKSKAPVYAQISSKSKLESLKKPGDFNEGAVLQVVSETNLIGKLNNESLKPFNKERLMEKAKNNLHYMSSPILENVPLLQSPTPTKKTSSGHNKLAKSSPGRSSSLDFDKININSNAIRSFSVDFSEDKNIEIDNEKIQKMVNEVYSKCLAMPQDSDSESAVSTPDDVVSKPLPGCHHTSPEDAQKERQQKMAERKTYLKRVCSRARSFHRPSLGFPHLFEYLLLIGLDLNPARCKVPYIKAKYPYDANVPDGIEQLCFPDATDWPPQACAGEFGVGNCYCIVITHVSGTRKYGYCRRVQPEGAPICLPLAYCIVSPYKANHYFGQVLAELESRHGQPDQIMSSFIQQLYECPFPPPGKGLLITNPATGDKVEMLQRKLDPRQEDVDLARLLQLLRFSLFLQLFNTLLLERKVILLSYSISKLSTCVEGLCASLYPFHWQHTLVPIVPSTLPDLCQAPTPYLIGLLKPRDSNMPPPLPFATLDQVLVVDVDENKVLRSCGDESSVLPGRLARGLKEALQCAAPSRDDSLSPAHNLIASEALVALFVQLIGHYRDHIITSSNTGERHFQREGFVKKVQSNSVQNFLDWFTETTMFTAFIESRLDRSADPYGLFEQRCVENLAQSQLAARGYRANINKTVKSFGDRFKEWTNST